MYFINQTVSFDSFVSCQLGSRVCCCRCRFSKRFSSASCLGLRTQRSDIRVLSLLRCESPSAHTSPISGTKTGYDRCGTIGILLPLPYPRLSSSLSEKQKFTHTR